MRSGRKVLLGIIRRLRSAQNHRPARLARVGHDFEDIRACQQICIDADGLRRSGAENREQLLLRTESGIVNIYLVSFHSKMRREVKYPQRNIGLHDLLLFAVLKEEVAMREQQLHDATPASAGLAFLSACTLV